MKIASTKIEASTETQDSLDEEITKDEDLGTTLDNKEEVPIVEDSPMKDAC